MKRLFLSVAVLLALSGVSRAEGRFDVVQGQAPAADGKPGAVPVMIKLDTDSGETWRLVSSGGAYWWIPIKNGMIAEKKAEAAAPAAPAAQ